MMYTSVMSNQQSQQQAAQATPTPVTTSHPIGARVRTDHFGRLVYGTITGHTHSRGLGVPLVIVDYSESRLSAHAPMLTSDLDVVSLESAR